MDWQYTYIQRQWFDSMNHEEFLRFYEASLLACHQSHQLQTRDQDPKVKDRELLHLNLGVIFERKPMAQHLPLNDQLFDMHRLIFEL